MTIESKRIVGEVYDAIIAGRGEDVFGALHSEFRADIPPVVPWGGSHEAAAFGQVVLPRVLEVVDLSTLKVLSLLGENDNVFATATLTTRDGKAEILIGEHWTVREGKISNLRVFYFDPRPLIERS